MPGLSFAVCTGRRSEGPLRSSKVPHAKGSSVGLSGQGHWELWEGLCLHKNLVSDDVRFWGPGSERVLAQKMSWLHRDLPLLDPGLYVPWGLSGPCLASQKDHFMPRRLLWIPGTQPLPWSYAQRATGEGRRCTGCWVPGSG
ncbi:hypothetical protein HJG60_012057 [Phyllostomus discolor]|uniref:Uncharacterized protein n=1 Tax=Phyllostomus discolor TaxID=89673 RepID=A0A833ZLV3_9CHIR|nr:hypothetical protein HJG60_012057 [Phyllostomus discolor]